MKRPNFFILGAPKCGTTSLAAWLGGHPRVFMSTPKEPNYFARDFKHAGQWSRARYEGLFRGADNRHAVVAEASTSYLQSRVAVSEILRYAPDARFAVGIRNPVQMVISIHRQRFNEAAEFEEDVERAWQLQEARRTGRARLPLGSDAGSLLYGEVCLLGEHLSRLLAQVPRDRVFIYSLDDLAADPRAVWLQLLEFLDVPDDGRREFPVYNQGQRLPRWLRVGWRVALNAKGKLHLNHVNFGLLERLQARMGKARETEVSARFRHELATYFAEDVRRLSRLTGRDCTAWLTREAGRSA